MEAPIRIRQADLSDWEEILAIEQLNFPAAEAASAEVLKEQIADTFLLAELHGQLAGYIVGPAIQARYLTDDLFSKVSANSPEGGFIAVQSLSVHPDFQRQGVGTLLIAALKETVVQEHRQGISLTCHDELIPYFEMNGFVHEGISDSTHGGGVWSDMVWENPNFKEK
ncbi:GNAT family N-acetyltransferase [Streptococcus cristatus]|uniref:GNAT family N-acetyltransferase n=1 Tax=Streptococcus cristatus TaxID=45634 RepID=UPI0005F07D02|nr:GNAT family N-acetyltransferase [Streptococcus cristatus]KJQ58167.1 acetyltransferase (GNAT) family protein [Streptococcus cristatus]QIP48962.1 GNAT family N-acetyltransferase [Streptococcus cristatus ATCC 51100]